MGLLSEEQGDEGKSGFTDPIGMGLLGLGASLMQQSGWRHRPISTAEQWGYAIPAGMQAYAQQAHANAQRDEARALLEQEAQAQAQAQAVAQAEQQAEEQRKMLFTKAVLESKLSEPRKNNLLAMWGINPTEAAKRFDEATTPSDKYKNWIQTDDWNPETGQRSKVLVNPANPNEKVVLGLSGLADRDVQHQVLGIDQDGNPSAQEHQWAIIYDGQGNEVGKRYIGPTGGVTEVTKRKEDQEFRLEQFVYTKGQDAAQNQLDLDKFVYQQRQDVIGNELAQARIDNDQAQFATTQSWRELEQTRNYEQRKAHQAAQLKQWGRDNNFTQEQMAAQAARFEETMAARNAEFALRFGLDERRFSDQQDKSKEAFDEQIRQYEKTHTFKTGTEAAKKAELDRAYNLTVKKFEENLRKTAKSEKLSDKQIALAVKSYEENIRRNAAREGLSERQIQLSLKQHEETLRRNNATEGFTEEQIENSVNQFAQNLALRKDQFSMRHELALETFGFTREKWEDQKNQWARIAERGAKEDDRAYNLRAEAQEYQMIQDAVRNDLTVQQIENQVSQFRETFEKQGAQFERTHDLKELIFQHGVDKTERQFENELETRAEQVRQFEATLEFKGAQAVEGVRQFEINSELDAENFRQRVVQHLATVKQHGETNGLSRDRIEIQQRALLQRIADSERSHLLSLEDQNLRQLKFDADQEYRDRKLAQDAINQEYQKGRDKTADAHWEKQFAQRLKEQAAKLVSQGLSRDQAKGIAHANLEFQKFKFQYESDKRPRTLYGEDARAWAAENSVAIQKTGTPVVKFDKYGNFEGEIDYIKAGYGKAQLDFLSDKQDKWMSNPDIKAANKLGRLLQSLKTLEAQETGVAEFAMIYKFMKSLDETSTVLASEFRNAAEAGRSAIENLELWADKQFSGDQLSEEQQAHIIEAVTGIAHAHLTHTINENMGAYLSLAEEQGVKEQDLRDALPNILGDYFKKYPYKEAAQTTGGGTVDKSALSNAAAAKQIDNLK